MRVIHVYKTYLPESRGGVEQFINQIARGVSKHGIQVEVLTLTKKNTHKLLSVDGHSVHQCKVNIEIASTPFSISSLQQFSKLSKEADIIHYHYPYPFADCLHFFARVKKPTILTYHSDIIKQKYLAKLYKPLRTLFFNDVNSIVVTSENYLNSSADLRGYHSKTKIIPIGLDPESYPIPSDERLRHWKQRFGTKFFLFIGVIRYYKGLHFLIEAARQTNYPIVIVGGGPLLGELKEMGVKYGLRNVHFVGSVSSEDKVALLKLCYAFVFPSHLRSEAFGIALLEGAMYGKPLISCDISTGTTYINIHQETGLVIPPSDVDALKKAMDYLWNHPQDAETMGKNAQARFQRIFLGEKMIQSYIELYEDLTKNKK